MWAGEAHLPLGPAAARHAEPLPAGHAATQDTALSEAGDLLMVPRILLRLRIFGFLIFFLSGAGD